MRARDGAAALLALALLPCAAAQESAPAPEPRQVYLEYGGAARHTRTLALGVVVPWSFEHHFWGVRLTGHWDAYIAQWGADSPDRERGREHRTQIALVPTLRLRFDGGRSPFFVEAGVGISAHDARYRTPDKFFSSRLNFVDHHGLGFNFGKDRRHELMFVLRHVSNADLKQPNPGEDFGHLRLSLRW